MSRGTDLFTAADAARFCNVDLKTIHNWAARGKLPHHKTEGRHVRIQRVDLVAFLREYQMPMPDELTVGTPQVALLDADPQALGRLRRALEKRFAVTSYEDAVDALLAFGSAPPQAVVLAAPLTGVDVAHLIARLGALDRTAHVRTVVLGEEAVEGATATLPYDRQNLLPIRETLESITGLA